MRFVILTGCLLLAACSEQDSKAVQQQANEDGAFVAAETKANVNQVGANAERAGSRIANNMRDSIKRTNRKVRDWWLTPLPPEPEPQAVEASYCYHVLQDIVCYRQPMPGWEHRLAGYQGTNAAPPPAAMTQLLPQRNVDTVKAAQNRISNAKPVFVELPPDEKKPDGSQQQPENETIDPSHENLPDPALAPQL